MAVTIRGRTLSLPILQGGMGIGVSLDRLAGAVAAAFYGIPRSIRDQALPFIDGEVRNIYDRFIRRY